ncbi:MAG: hemolysin family protein [Anaerolineae bacterium]|nr:hemolysin family protein [Anaerolineae bacterium]
MSVLVSLLIILILILINGVFVAAEFSIIGVRPTRIEQLAESGHSTAQRVHKVLQSPALTDRYIATSQLGITLASLGLGMYGEPSIAHLLEPLLHDDLGLNGEIVHTISFIVALVFITYLHVVLGEMIPKSLALQGAERVVLALSTPMFLMQQLFNYPITILNKIGVLVLRVLRVPPPTEGARLHTPDELELIISDSVVGGLIESEEQQLIENIFEFSDLHVGQIMTPRTRIDAVPVNIDHAKLMETMFTSPHTRLPVYENQLDQILGIIHLKDLMHHYLESNDQLDLRSLLTSVPFVPEGLQADRLLTQFKKERVHMAIVLDEYGGTAGLVTLEDLIEEIVGEVHDEFDTDEEPSVTVIEPGHLVVSGETRLDEVSDYVDLQTENGDVETVGGILIGRIDLPPEIGAETTVNDATLRVEAANGMVIAKVSIHYPPPDEA